MKQYFKDSAVVLFQGDSITDCSRDKNDIPSLGNGYPKIIANIYHTMFPKREITFVNKGISGNRVRDLLSRYDQDFLAIKPDFISILIGINDVWRAFDRNDPCPLERFTEEYDLLLTKIRTDMPDTKIMIISPFVLHSLPDRETWHSDLDPKIEVCSKLAEKHSAIFLPMQTIFNKAVKREFTPAEIAADCVHPTHFGHAYIAAEYLKKLRIL